MIKLIYPVKYVGVTQGFKTSHKAIDMGWSSSYGGPNHDIIAPGDGVVTYVKKDYNRTDKNSLSYGNYVKIDHGNGIVTLLAHMKYNSVVVKVGDKVKRGDKIGIMGNTGYSKGTHLHYEVMINKEKVEPFKYTYATNEHIVGSGTKSKYNIIYLREDIKEMEEVKDNKSDNTPSDDVKEDNVIFEYVVPKDGIYKIRLNQNEKLVIKD